MSSKRRRVSSSRATPKAPKSLPHNTSNSAARFKDFALWAMIFAVTLVAHLPALQGGQLWDDDGHLTKPALQSLHGLWRIWFELGATQQYYPLLHSAFWIEHRIWGDAMVGYHLTNVVLHAISACLIVLIMRRLSLPGAWLAGFVFTVHPVYVESVAWISEQKSTLSGVFYLAALLVYLRFDEDRRNSKYLLALGLFVLAMLSKSVTATLPVVILVIFWWRRGRLEWKRDVRPLLPWFAIGISGGLFTAWVERTYIGARGADFLLTPAQRILIAGRAICFYFGKLLWPSNLTFFYPRWNVDPGAWQQWLFPVVVLAVLVGLGFVATRRRGPLASFFLFSATLFPVLGFLNVFPFRYSYVADHFQYLASLGIIAPGIALLVSTIERTSTKTVVIASSVVLILILGALTWQQSLMYSDIETLYRITLERNPDSWVAHYNLGVLLAGKPETHDEAIEEFQAATRLNPGYAWAHNDLAAMLANTPGRTQDAIAEYKAALQDDPTLAEAHYDLGNLLLRIPGRQQDAIAEYQAALRIKPDFAAAYTNLGIQLAAIPGRQQDAMAEFRTALQLNPDLAEAHNAMGLMLSRMPGRLPDAIAEFQAAVRANPDYAEAHLNLGNALSQNSGRLADALNEYGEAVRIRPDYAEAHFFYGVALSHIPERQQDAIAEFQTAEQLSPAHAAVANNWIQLLRSHRHP
jgi:protein O-mannosyl-transferase